VRVEISISGATITNEDFILLVMEEYVARYDDDTPWDQIRDFHASDGFVTDFKRRNGFSSLRLRFPLVSVLGFGDGVPLFRRNSEVPIGKDL
jgi:hypothetical protein